MARRSFGKPNDEPKSRVITPRPRGRRPSAIGAARGAKAARTQLTHEQKVAHLKAAARIAAVHSIGNFVVRNEESYRYAVEKMGVQKMAVGKDFDELMAKYKAGERERNVSVAKGFGVKDPEAILDAHARNVEKWQKLSKDIGRDPDKLTEALWREVYSKLDPEKL